VWGGEWVAKCSLHGVDVAKCSLHGIWLAHGIWFAPRMPRGVSARIPTCTRARWRPRTAAARRQLVAASPRPGRGPQACVAHALALPHTLAFLVQQQGAGDEEDEEEERKSFIMCPPGKQHRLGVLADELSAYVYTYIPKQK